MLIEAYAWGIISENYRRMQVTQLFFSVDYYDFTTSVLNLNRMRTEIIWWNIVHWNYMEERLFISGTSTCLLITSLFIRKLLAVAGSTCCMQSATTHNASSAPTHLDDESVMTSVVSNQKSEIVFQKGPDSSNPTTTSLVSEPRGCADCTALKHMMIVFFWYSKENLRWWLVGCRFYESSHVEGHLSSAELTTSAAQNVNPIKIQDIKKKKNVCFLPSQQHLSL